MGSSFPHAVQHASSRCPEGTSSLQQQRHLVNKLSENGSSSRHVRSTNAAILLRGQRSSYRLLYSNRTRRSPQRNLKIRCCEAGAAEVDILVPEGGATLGVPFEHTDFNAVRPYRESPELSRSFTGSEALIAEEDTLARLLDYPSKNVNEFTRPLTNKEEPLQFVDDNEEKNLLQQMWDIVVFAGPALGIWLSGPLMSLIDTAVVGKNSSLELAALGPGTVFCDQLGYVFMFLSVATSNLIATSLAKQDEARAAQHLSRLLFVALVAGVGMFLFTGAFAELFLKKFVGPENMGLVSAAFSYVKIRGYAWPAILVGMVAQSASLGMQDSWGPLKVLAVASFVNLFGDILLCTYLGQGIAGAAWATMVSQYIGGFLMLRSLKKKGYSLALAIPSTNELLHMVEIAAPVLLTMLSKVSFYALITYLSTSLGAVTLGAHQVMIGIYSTCTVSGEPLCQTAQSFMPAYIQGKNPNRKKAQLLLKSLLLIGGILGISLGFFALNFPWLFPQVFTNDAAVISQMRAVSIPFFCALVTTPPLLSLEGTLLAGRDLKFLSLSMLTCFIGGSAMLTAFKQMGFGLQGFWWTLFCFQSARFLSSYWRLQSAKSVLRDPEPKLKAV
ncbi:hypothetical protein GOP47_0001970 [Adiantum capillus-veneris]|uniref:Protein DETOXIFICATION n=1 Tax=Adiantum capillus-veneris TaxID=13818 RepID=A0A9D4VB47_ADICA|nr:hypothetical protein GOP47_0001970 [Adiantum capillus-veneris]